MTICAMCFVSFAAYTSYGICPGCYSSDRLYQWDKLQSATREAKRREQPASLDLRSWLTVLSDHDGKCAYCQVHHAQSIEVVDSAQGLVYGNVVPICAGCREHKRSSWNLAAERVAAYLRGCVAEQLPLSEEEGLS